MATTVVIEGLNELLAKMDAGLIGGPLKSFLERSAINVQSEGRTLAPVDTGRLRGSIAYELDKSSPPLWAEIGPNVSYGSFVEFGTARMGDPEVPHKSAHWPPAGALDRWASRHGIAGGGAVVARAIGRRGGLRPVRYMRTGLERSLTAISGYLQQMAGEIEKLWSR